MGARTKGTNFKAAAAYLASLPSASPDYKFRPTTQDLLILLRHHQFF